MKGVRLCTLEGSTGVFETKRELLISKSAPWTDKSGLVLITGGNIDLVIPRETVHKGVHFTSVTLVNELIDEWCGEVIFRTGPIDVMIIDTNSNDTLFFIDRDYVGDPICKWDGVNKASFKKLFNFCFNGYILSGVHGA